MPSPVRRLNLVIENMHQRRIRRQPGDRTGQAKAHQHVIIDAQHIGAQAGIHRSNATDRAAHKPIVIVRHEELPLSHQYIVICDMGIKRRAKISKSG
jgi:hypothetical protein